MKIHRSAAWVASFAAILALPVAASAQTRTPTSTNQRSSTGSMGSSYSSGLGGSASGFGGSSASSFGQRSGTSSFGSGSQFGTSGQFGTMNNQSGGFVGRDSADMQQWIGGGNYGTQGGATVQPRFNTTNNRNQANQNRGGNTGNAPEIRAGLRLGFARSSLAAPDLDAVLTARLATARNLHVNAPVDVTVESGTATLRGQAATAYDRVLAEQLVRLTPGIAQVRNELTLPESPAAP